MNELEKRKIEILEKELLLKKKELAHKISESTTLTWRSPIVLAVLAAAIGAMSNGGLTFYSNHLARNSAALEHEDNLEIEKTKAENSRILETIREGKTPAIVERNLKFLISTKLIESEETTKSILDYYSAAEPGTGPANEPVGESRAGIRGIYKNDDAVLLSDMPSGSPAVMLSKSVGILNIASKPGFTNIHLCTAFAISMNQIVSAEACLENAESANVIFFPSGRIGDDAIAIDLDLDSVQRYGAGTGLGYSIVNLKSNLSASVKPLTIDETDIADGTYLGMIYFRSGGETEPSVVWNVDDCKVYSQDNYLLYHLCDSGPGTAGSPVFKIETGNVVGVHIMRDQRGGVARMFSH